MSLLNAAALLFAVSLLLTSLLRRPRLNSITLTVNRNSPTPALIFDLDSVSGLTAAIAVAAEQNELILYTSDWKGIASGVNLVEQLAVHSLHTRTLLLADRQSTCERVAATWPWAKCGWSRGIPGFERYASTGASLIELWTLWSAKWLVLAKLVERRINVLMTDADILVLADPYPLLWSAPLARFALVLPPEGARVNVGWLYARGANATGGGLISLLWDMVRRLRLFLQQITLRDQNGVPSVAGLWDQGLFSDAFASAVSREHSYAFTWLHARRSIGQSPLRWPPVGFSAANASTLLSRLWRRSADARARRPGWLLPSLPRRHPQRGPWERPEPLLWNVLHPLPPLAGLRADLIRARPDLLPSSLRASTSASEAGDAAASAELLAAYVAATPAGSTSSRALHTLSTATVAVDGEGGSGLRAVLGDPTSALTASTTDLVLDLVAAAPDWLHCTTGHWMITAGWVASQPPVCTVLHLVECRSQFAHYGSLDTLKANRPYVTAAYGHWHSATMRHTSQPATRPMMASLRAIRLGPKLLDAAASSTGVGALLNSLQLLATLATLTGRVPVVPRVDCGSRWLKRHPMTAAGVADDYVLQLPRASNGSAAGRRTDPEGAGSVSCHLAIGGADCVFPHVLPAWQPLQTASTAAAGSDLLTPLDVPSSRLVLGGVVAGDDAERDPLALRTLRRRAQQQQHDDAPMLEIDWPELNVTAYPHPSPLIQRFRCGIPEDLYGSIHGDALHTHERRQLEQLQTACPAFFAPRGLKRRQLDWLHRRRTIRGSRADGCGPPS